MLPANWLVETSGIPFGLMGDMLYLCGNQWRGMLYGMSSRLGWSTENIICDPKPLWKVWDEFGIADAKMHGYWDKSNPVTTSDSSVLATSYIKKDSILIAIAGWNKKNVDVYIHIDAAKLGWQHGEVMLAPAIDNYRPQRTFNINNPLTVEPGKGWLLIIKKKKQ
ncbi:glycoside hydrolase domain-containing protein [Parafilimonas sp.]|uniref:glycoside hydrolase domain-containing protein n=1 Tax=Parafilimonas sp. TaxID=1969739 RepID=UPI0039E5D8FC